MESYNNYQDIINAIKAEYVIVRDLKRTANAKKRELNNAQSFVNRKANEEDTLDLRSENAKSSAISRADNSVGSIKSAIGFDYKTRLSESITKLAIIDAEYDKLVQLHEINPEKWEGFSENELQSMSSLRNVLSSAINETKYIFENDIIESPKLGALKEKIKITVDTHQHMIVQQEFDTVVYNIKMLIDSTRSLFGTFLSDAAQHESQLTIKKDELVTATRNLVQLKSELADLLDSNAAQSDIDSKEEAIESLKANIIEKANYLKETERVADLFYAGKHKSFTVYFEIIKSLHEETMEWVGTSGAYELVRYSNRADAQRSIQKSIRDFIVNMLDGLSVNIPTINGLNLHSEIIEIFNEVSYDKVNGDKFLDGSYRKKNILGNLTDYINFDSDDKPVLDKRIPRETWDDTFYYLRQLHRKAADYMDSRRQYNRQYGKFNFFMNKFEEEFSKGFTQYSNAIGTAKAESLFNSYQEQLLTNGRWRGTPGQEEELYNLEVTKRNRAADLGSNSNRLSLVMFKSQLLRSIFPVFFAEYDSLTSALASANDTLTDVSNTAHGLQVIAQTAYDYLQTLTQGTPEYDAAYIDWQTKDTAFNEYDRDFKSPAAAAVNEAYQARESFRMNSGNQSTSFGWSIHAFDLFQAEGQIENYQNSISSLESDMTQISSSIETLKADMIFEETTLDSRLESKMWVTDQNYKSYKAYDFWSNYVYKHLSFVDSLRSRVVSAFNSLEGFQSTEAEALGELTTFLQTGLYNMYRDELELGERVLEYSEFRGNFMKDSIQSVLDLDNTEFSQYFSWDSNSIQTHADNPEFLSNKMRIINRNYRQHANGGFADEVINFVNTGVANF